MYTAYVYFFTNLDLFCIDNARVIYRKIRYIFQIFMTHFRPINWTSQNERQTETVAARSPLSSVKLRSHSSGVAPGTPVP